MEWQQILGFYHVAKLGSFTRAAEVTFRTQSALSQQVRSLEQELGVSLLERIGKRKLRLTAAGERFFQFSATVLENHSCLLEDLAELKGLQTGQLKIAGSFTVLYRLFPQKVKAYVEQFPHVELMLLDRPQQNVIELVKSGDVDFGIALESLVPGDLTVIPWKVVKTVLVTPTGHPLTRLKQVQMKHLAKYPLILPPRGLRYPGRVRLEEELQKSGLDYRILLESSNIELSTAYVEQGLGICFATIAIDLTGLLKAAYGWVELVSLDHYFKPDHIAIIMRKDKVLTAYKKAFINGLLGDAPVIPGS